MPADDKIVIDPRSAASRCRRRRRRLERRVDYHYASVGRLGGGEYDRAAEVADAEAPPHLALVPTDHATIQAAIDAIEATGDGGVVQIVDSGRYEETLAIAVRAERASSCAPTTAAGRRWSSAAISP